MVLDIARTGSSWAKAAAYTTVRTEDDICELCPQLTMQQRIAAFCGAMSDQSKWWVVGRNLTVILPLSLQRAAALVT